MTSSLQESPLGTVWWDENPDRKRTVKRFCERCQNAVYYSQRMRSLNDVGIVSPTGIGHSQRWDGDAVTACGVKADGPDWWWRL